MQTPKNTRPKQESGNLTEVDFPQSCRAFRTKRSELQASQGRGVYSRAWLSAIV